MSSLPSYAAGWAHTYRGDKFEIESVRQTATLKQQLIVRAEIIFLDA